MALYPKKLRNHEDLEQEKKALLLEKRQLEEEGLFSFDLLGNDKDKKESAGDAEGEDGHGFDISSLLSLLPVASPVIGIVIDLAKGLFGNRDKKEDARHTGKKERGIISKLVSEVIVGYLKWKAVELSYKGAKHIIKSKREKKEA